jgi:hypothetical protein
MLIKHKEASWHSKNNLTMATPEQEIRTKLNEVRNSDNSEAGIRTNAGSDKSDCTPNVNRKKIMNVYMEFQSLKS